LGSITSPDRWCGEANVMYDSRFVYSYYAGIHANGDRYTGEKHQVATEGQREEWILTPGDSKLASCKPLSLHRIDCSHASHLVPLMCWNALSIVLFTVYARGKR
jgi:hypothetical protein